MIVIDQASGRVSLSIKAYEEELAKARKLEYLLQDARNNEARANARLQTMKKALADARQDLAEWEAVVRETG